VSGDPVLAPGLLVRPSPVESDRFGREVVRVTIGEGAPDHHTLLAALDEVSADVLVVRYDAARVELGGLLGASRWAVLPAGALTYWEVALPFDSAPAQAGLEVRSAETLAAQDRRGVSELVRLIVHASFADYGNHYRANPLLDPSDALEGYEDWALRSLTEHPGDVLLLMHRTVPVGFATLEFGADGADVEVLLAGLVPSVQRQGRYGTLLGGCATTAAARGVGRLFTSTQVHNTRVQRAWVRAGLRPFAAVETVHLVDRALLAEALASARTGTPGPPG